MGHETSADARLKELTTRFMAERHGLIAYIYALVHDPVAAEDIFQEVWLRLADAAGRNLPITDPARWFRGVARNLILHRWRDAQRSRVIVDSELLDLVELAFVEQDPASDALEQRRRGLEECMRTLPAPAREVLHLTYVLNLTAAEVGARLRRSSGSVLMSLSRLRRDLEACVNRRLKAAAQ